MINLIKKIISKFLPLSIKNYTLDLDSEEFKYSYLTNYPFNKLYNLSFQQLCLIFQTDKASINHSVIKSNKIQRVLLQTHNYSFYYDKYFAEIRDNMDNIIEIGCLTGASSASLFFYFKNSNIFSLDINFSANNVFSKRITREFFDQSIQESINNFLTKYNNKKFDLIIDDGSHIENDILLTLKNIFKILKDKSFYIIEDVSYENQPKVLNFCDDLINKNIVDNKILTKLELSKIKEVKKFKSEQNFYSNSNEKSFQQYIIFIQLY